MQKSLETLTLVRNCEHVSASEAMSLAKYQSMHILHLCWDEVHDYHVFEKITYSLKNNNWEIWVQPLKYSESQFFSVFTQTLNLLYTD